MLIGLDEIGKSARRKARQEKRQEKKSARKEKRQEKKSARKEKRAEKKEVRKEKREARGGSRLKKVLLAPARAAFFVLMKVNFLRLRTKLREGWKKDKGAIDKKVIRKFGFKRENFLKELNRKESERLSSWLGSDPATATAVAQATPILVQVASVLTSLGVAAGALASAKNSLTGKDRAMADEYEAGLKDVDEGAAPSSDTTGSPGEPGRESSDKNSPSEGSTSIKKAVILGVIVAAGYFAYIHFTNKNEKAQ